MGRRLLPPRTPSRLSTIWTFGFGPLVLTPTPSPLTRNKRLGTFQHDVMDPLMDPVVSNFYSALVGVAECWDERVGVCLSVGEHLLNTTSDLQSSPNLCACYLAVARASYGGVAIRYVLPVLWKTSYLHAHNGPNAGMSMPLQRVTLLRRRAQANAPAASY